MYIKNSLNKILMEKFFIYRSIKYLIPIQPSHIIKFDIILMRRYFLWSKIKSGAKTYDSHFLFQHNYGVCFLNNCRCIGSVIKNNTQSPWFTSFVRSTFCVFFVHLNLQLLEVRSTVILQPFKVIGVAIVLCLKGQKFSQKFVTFVL